MRKKELNRHKSCSIGFRLAFRLSGITNYVFLFRRNGTMDTEIREKPLSLLAITESQRNRSMCRVMIDRGAIVIYNEPSQKLDGHCGIVEGVDREEPDYVWVRWVGETADRKELIRNLEVI